MGAVCELHTTSIVEWNVPVFPRVFVWKPVGRFRKLMQTEEMANRMESGAERLVFQIDAPSSRYCLTCDTWTQLRGLFLYLCSHSDLEANCFGPRWEQRAFGPLFHLKMKLSKPAQELGWAFPFLIDFVNLFYLTRGCIARAERANIYILICKWKQRASKVLSQMHFGHQLNNVVVDASLFQNRKSEPGNTICLGICMTTFHDKRSQALKVLRLFIISVLLDCNMFWLVLKANGLSQRAGSFKVYVHESAWLENWQL